MLNFIFLKVEKNLDSLFFQTTHSKYFYEKLKDNIDPYNKVFKFERTVKNRNYDNKFESFLFKGVHQGESIETKNHFITVWKHRNEPYPVNLEQAIEQIKEHKLDAFVFFDKEKNKFYWMNHFFSKINLYYNSKDGGLSLSNDIDLLVKNKELTPAAKEIFKELGWLPPEMNAFEGVQSSSPDRLYSYQLSEKTVESEEVINLNSVFDLKFDMRPSTAEFYRLFKESIARNVVGNCYVLTGGCDTRLILSTIDKTKDLLFWADNTQARKDIFFDSCIFRHILNEKGLKGFLLDNKKSGKDSFEPINLEYDDWNEIAPFFDDHPMAVSGMFGGELLGGGYLSNVTGSKVLIGDKLADDIMQLANKYPLQLGPYFLEANNPLKQAYFMRLFFKTPMSEFYYPHNVWKTPVKHCRLFTQKPFLNKDILLYLARLSPSVLMDHKFYMQIYKDCAADWLKYPIQNLGVSKNEGFLKPELFYDFDSSSFEPKLKVNDAELRRSAILGD